MIKKWLSLFVVVIASISSFSEANAQLDINIKWTNSDNAPLGVYMDYNGQHRELIENDNVFSITDHTLAQLPFSDLTLVAKYANYKTSIPIRAYRNQPNKFSLVIDTVKPMACGYTVVEKLEASASDSITWLSQVMVAQELARRTGEAACSTALKRRVTKVWFDASYRLADKFQQYRLDEAAYDDLRKISKFAQYANNYKKQSDTFYARNLYGIMKKTSTQKNYDDAIELAEYLKADVKGNEFLSKYIKLPEEKLEADIEYYTNKKNNT